MSRGRAQSRSRLPREHSSRSGGHREARSLGLQTKQVAHELGIAVKTADRHIQNAYAKMGVSTRAAATLFAMEHGLAAWGELPISLAARRP